MFQQLLLLSDVNTLEMKNFETKSSYAILLIKPGFHFMANATTTTQNQNDFKVELSSFTLIALF